ncbi:hypothetical protein [Micromonospora zhanjiangensis]
MTDTELRTAVRESVAELLTVPLTADTDHTLLAELAPAGTTASACSTASG